MERRVGENPWDEAGENPGGEGGEGPGVRQGEGGKILGMRLGGGSLRDEAGRGYCPPPEK